MGPLREKDHGDEFVLELMRAGSMLCELAADLIDAMPADAYPGEQLGRVVIEMLCGTVRTSLESADPREVRRATELIDQAASRTLEHLRLACELSRRTHPEGGTTGRRYG